jgi:hypothetical protein
MEWSDCGEPDASLSDAQKQDVLFAALFAGLRSLARSIGEPQTCRMEAAMEAAAKAELLKPTRKQQP